MNELPLTTGAPPIACSLDGGDYERRVQEWRRLLAGSERIDVSGGVRATLPTEQLVRAAELAAAEQGCCAFYAITLDLHGPTFDLTITAPEQAQSMLAELLPAAEPA